MIERPERIDIHNLILEEPKQKDRYIFDTERDIRESDWQKLQHYLSWSEDDIHINHLGTILRSAKVIAPERFSTLKFVKPNLESTIRNDFDLFTCSYVFPELKDRASSDYISVEIEKALKIQEPLVFHYLIISYVTHFPKRIGEITKTIDLNRELEKIPSEITKSNADSAVRHLALLKLLFSQSDFKPEISIRDWKLLSGLIGELRQNYIPFQGQPVRYEEELEDFWDYLFSLKILAADKVTITNDGIVLEEKKQFLTETPVQPEMRRY